MWPRLCRNLLFRTSIISKFPRRRRFVLLVGCERAVVIEVGIWYAWLVHLIFEQDKEVQI
jgi:hypothetical protein